MDVPYLLTIPAYRERDRLPKFLPNLCESLGKSGLPVALAVVDDGSGPEQAEWLQGYLSEMRPKYPLLLPAILLPKNGGKGHAVYEGWRKLCQTERHLPQIRWVGFIDADGAVSAEEAVRILQKVHQEDQNAATVAVYAVRTGEAGTQVHRVWRRKLSGWVFRWLTRRFFHFPIPDTQCGCKWVRKEAFLSVSPKLTETRFCFDVELTHYLLEHGKITSLPISWEESPGSRLGAASVLNMARSLFQLKKALKS